MERCLGIRGWACQLVRNSPADEMVDAGGYGRRRPSRKEGIGRDMCGLRAASSAFDAIRGGWSARPSIWRRERSAGTSGEQGIDRARRLRKDLLTASGEGSNASSSPARPSGHPARGRPVRSTKCAVSRVVHRDRSRRNRQHKFRRIAQVGPAKRFRSRPRFRRAPIRAPLPCRTAPTGRS